tara:strand:- start:982 stop:1800 length:819 start_codon:yes stop_codon:yes gene_type:complete
MINFLIKYFILKLNDLIKKYFKNNLPIRFIKLLYKIFYSLKQFFSSEIISSKYGIQFKKNWIDRTFRIYIEASYGYFFWDFLSGISNDFIFIDIGSNQGLYTICAAKNKFCSAVYSFEPINSTYSLLSENVSINKTSNKCYLFKKAISDQAGQSLISKDKMHSGAATLRESDKKCLNKKEKIETINHKILNNIIKNQNYSQIILKVDVEGFEEVVFNTLIKSNFFDEISTIYYEVDEKWVEPELLKNILKGEGFTRFIKKGNGSHYDVFAKR